MKNLQKIILWNCYLAVFFIASTASLQAQRTPYTGGNLRIRSDNDIPSNVASIPHITGYLFHQ